MVVTGLLNQANIFPFYAGWEPSLRTFVNRKRCTEGTGKFATAIKHYHSFLQSRVSNKTPQRFMARGGEITSTWLLPARQLT